MTRRFIIRQVTQNYFSRCFYFLHFDSTRICDDNYKYKAAVPDLCADVAANVYKPKGNKVDSRASIKSMSGCDDVYVNLQDNSNNYVPFGPFKLGLCTLSQTLTVCISKGEKERGLYWYTYDEATKTCTYDGGWEGFIESKYLRQWI